MEHWQRRLEPYRDKFKVGLSWSGRKMLTDGRDRSIPLSHLAPVAAENVIFLTLQTEGLAGTSSPPGMHLIDCSNDLHDFADTAGLMANLDLIISIDTAAAHLAGAALGRPVWTLLLHHADWRWLLDREDSPWYPTMRLFSQPADGDWNTVIQIVAKNLRTEAIPRWRSNCKSR